MVLALVLNNLCVSGFSFRG